MIAAGLLLLLGIALALFPSFRAGFKNWFFEVPSPMRSWTPVASPFEQVVMIGIGVGIILVLIALD